MRLLRGTALTILVWGFAWAVGFSPILFLNWRNLNVEGFYRPFSFLLINELAVGAFGALSGGLFALLLAGFERRTGWGGLRTRRVALWGFLAGLVPGLLFGVLSGGLRPSLGLLLICGIAGLLGSLLGLLHVRLAQRQPPLAPD